MALKQKKASQAARTGSVHRDERPTEPVHALTDRIAQEAYKLWEQRGRLDGSALQDWLDAEAMVTRQTHESDE